MPGIENINSYRNAYLENTAPDNFDRGIFENLNILSTTTDCCSENPKVYFSITIPQHFSNHRGVMHGGAVATLFDGITGSAVSLIKEPGFWDGTQVSRTLEIKYFRPVPLDEPLDAVVELVHVGKSLATIRGLINRGSDGTLLAACQHELFHQARAKL